MYVILMYPYDPYVIVMLSHVILVLSDDYLYVMS
jgi:hypothetical protein